MAVFAAFSVQAFVSQAQAVYRFPSYDVGIDDFVYVGFSHSAVPYSLGINDNVRSVLALIKASGLISADSAFQSSRGKFLLEEFLKTSLGRRITATPGMALRTLVPADKNVTFKFGHRILNSYYRRKTFNHEGHEGTRRPIIHVSSFVALGVLCGCRFPRVAIHSIHTIR